MVKKHILILNWQFPPNSGIGGRRCAKLAKEWKALGHEITILTQATKLEGKGSPNWISEETIQSFNYHFIDKKNNFNALYFKSGFLNALLLFILKKWHAAFTSGNPIDDCRFAESSVLKSLENIHSQNPIDLLFVSCAPFSLSLYACKFRNKHKEIALWCDFRDPWKNAVNYGLQLLNNRQRKKELDYQKMVGRESDYISAPYEAILAEFDNEKTRAKKILIPHFTDRLIVKKVETIQYDCPTLIYAGNIYEGSTPFILTALKALKNLPADQQPHLHFIGNFSNNIQEDMRKNYVKIQFTQWMDKGLEHQIESCQGLIILLSADNQHFHTSKFYDYLPFGKPYFYIGPKGDVYKTIVNNQLGCSLEQYNPNFLNIFNPINALKLAEEHTAKKMAITITQHAFSA